MSSSLALRRHSEVFVDECDKRQTVLAKTEAKRRRKGTNVHPILSRFHVDRFDRLKDVEINYEDEDVEGLFAEYDAEGYEVDQAEFDDTVPADKGYMSDNGFFLVKHPALCATICTVEPVASFSWVNADFEDVMPGDM